MTTLTAVTPAIVASNYTRDEVLREARRVFVHPTPLIQMMLHHLDRSSINPQSSTAEPVNAVNCCPACGAQLTLNETE